MHLQEATEAAQARAASLDKVMQRVQGEAGDLATDLERVTNKNSKRTIFFTLT